MVYSKRKIERKREGLISGHQSHQRGGRVSVKRSKKGTTSDASNSIT